MQGCYIRAQIGRRRRTRKRNLHRLRILRCSKFGSGSRILCPLARVGWGPGNLYAQFRWTLFYVDEFFRAYRPGGSCGSGAVGGTGVAAGRRELITRAPRSIVKINDTVQAINEYLPSGFQINSGRCSAKPTHGMWRWRGLAHLGQQQVTWPARSNQWRGVPSH